MPSPTPALPPYAAVASLLVGAPAGATRAMTLANATAFLRGRVTHPVIHAPALFASAGDVYFAYCRRPGVESLRVQTETRAGGSVDSTATISEPVVAFGSGSVAWHVGAGSVPLDGGMDGATLLPATSVTLLDYPVFEGFLDVRGLPVGSTVVLKVTSTGAGIQSLFVDEVPVPIFDPVSAPTTEPGVDAAWTQAGNTIVDGSSGSPRGVGRLFAELDAARGAGPRHWQVARPTGGPFSRNSTSFGPLALGGGAHSDEFVFYARARRLRETSSPNTLLFGAVYRYSPTYAGLTNSYLRMDAVGVTGSSTFGQIALTNTSGAWVHGTATAQWPCDGTAQELAVTFGARTENTGGGTTSDLLEVALLYLREQES